MYKLLLVDDHDLVRYGIKRALLEHLAELDRIDEASTGQQALGLAQQTAYNLILLDISLPDRNGLDLLTQMREYFPKTAVILLSMHPERDYAIRAFRAGASGYLHKAIPFEKLVHAVSKVLQGEMYISPAVAALLVQEVAAGGGDVPLHSGLSDREFQVVGMICNGKTPTEMAEMLGVSIKTISTYRARIMSKLRIKTNADIINYCNNNHLSL